MDDPDTERPPPAEGGFVARWSRRKQAAAAGQPLPDAPPPVAPPIPAATPVAIEDGAPPDLPDPAMLDFADDFTAYLQARVPAAMKRAAMKRLFSDPSFNRMDGLDVYIEDFNRIGDLPAADAALLAHAKEVLLPSPARRLAEYAERDGGGAGEAAAGAAAPDPAAAGGPVAEGVELADAPAAAPAPPDDAAAAGPARGA